jgi:hypothetical protein
MGKMARLMCQRSRGFYKSVNTRHVNSDTIMIVGSAPNFPHGIVDDIRALASIAKNAGILHRFYKLCRLWDAYRRVSWFIYPSI